MALGPELRGRRAPASRSSSSRPRRSGTGRRRGAAAPRPCSRPPGMPQAISVLSVRVPTRDLMSPSPPGSPGWSARCTAIDNDNGSLIVLSCRVPGPRRARSGGERIPSLTMTENTPPPRAYCKAELRIDSKSAPSPALAPPRREIRSRRHSHGRIHRHYRTAYAGLPVVANDDGIVHDRRHSVPGWSGSTRADRADRRHNACYPVVLPVARRIRVAQTARAPAGQ